MGSVVFLVFVALTVTTIVYGCNDSETWLHKVFLDDDTYRVFMQWKPDEENITIKVTGKTKGWLAIGFSRNGDMVGSDIILGWVKNGKGYLQDRHGYGNDQPPIDKKNDVELLSAYENETHTTFCFRRRLNTCDQQDNPITTNTMKIIWAMNPDDPNDSDDPSSAKYHGPNNRGYKSQFLLSDIYPKPTTNDIKTWKVQMNLKLPNNKSTFHWCQFIKPPNITRKNHIVGYEPVIDHKQLMHHISLYECTGEDTNKQIDKISAISDSFPCESPETPPASLSCQKTIIDWTKGAEGEFFPPNVGIPFSFLYGKPVHYMINVHYNNPSLIKVNGTKILPKCAKICDSDHIHDSSALLVYYTNKLREYDGGILKLGYVLHQPYHIIPPGQEKWVSVAHCAPECLQKTFPTKKFKAFGAVLHGHQTTHKIVVRHFRGNEELPPVVQNDNVDYLYQAPLIFKDVEIYTTDVLTVECTTNTTNRTNTILGGPTLQNEMCFIFLRYYPRSNLTACNSHLSLEDIEQLTEVKHLWPRNSELEELKIKEPAHLRNVTLRNYLQNLPLNQTQIKTLQQDELESNKTPECLTDDKNKKPKDLYYVNYPKNLTPYIKNDTACKKPSKEL